MKLHDKKQPIIKDKSTPHKKTKTVQQPNKKSPKQKQKILEVLKQKDNKSFIQKFKDKHSIISKQGLLKLFQKQTFKPNKQSQIVKQIIKQSPKTQSHEQKKNKNDNKIGLKLKQKSLQRIKIDQIIKARSHRKSSQAVSVTKSVQLPQLNPRLVKIQKSISTTVHLRQKIVQSPIQKAHTDSIPKEIKKASSQHLKSKRKIDSYNFELDKFALDHLDFLDRFQERIRKRELTPSLY